MSDESAYEDEVPTYDEDDPEGDRREFLDSDDHKEIEDLTHIEEKSEPT